MRDVDTDFGVISTLAPAESVVQTVDFPNGVSCGDGGNLGKIDKLYVHVKVEGSKAVPESEILTFIVKHKSDTGAGDNLTTYIRPASALDVGGEFSFELPAEHEPYLSLAASADTTAGISLHAWLEMGERGK